MLRGLVIVIAVVALLGVAAAIATPKGRLPLALRGAYRIMRRDRGLAESDPAAQPVSALRRLLALGLVALAILLALLAK